MKKNFIMLMSVLTCFLLLSFSSFAQSGTISGKVTDEKSAPLSGATISVKGKSTSVVSGVNGQFTIENVAPSGTLIISYVGFTTKEVKYNAGGTVTISLVDNAKSEDEVVVTGVFDRRTRMQASVAISTLSSAQLDKIVPSSSIDLLKNLPGVYVNQSRGEVSGAVYTRGLSVGGSFYYVSMQEDGLPIMAAPGSSATDPIFKPDGFLRADASIEKVEAVRGGTASILGANAPGGIFNYISKTGKQKFAGEIRTRFGLEGNVKNPLFRVDGSFGGPLNKKKDLTYQIGGFYRYGNGPKYPGYPLSFGGQVKGNIQKTYKSGSLKLIAKFLNDNTAQFEFTPTTNFINPKPAGNFSSNSSTLIQGVNYTIPGGVWGRSQGTTFNSKNVGNYKDYSIGLNWDHRLGNGWTINNNARFSDKSSDLNVTAVVFPFRVDQGTFYGVSGNAARSGIFEFYNRNTGLSYGTVTKTGFAFTANNLNLPGSGVMPNALFYNPSAYNDIDFSDFIDQFTISKKLKNMSFSAGAFYATSHVTRFGSGPMAQSFATIEDKPQIVGIRYTNTAQNKVYQITDANGIANYGGAGYNTNDAKVKTSALFFGHNWEINDKLNFDWGIRYEGFKIDAKFAVPTRLPDSKLGVDGDSTTIYDSRAYILNPEQSFTKNLNTFSYSAGLNYKITDKVAIYTRFSQGRKSPDLGFFMDVANQQLTSGISAEAQDIKMFEAGLKVRTEKLNLFITPFYNKISNIPNFQIFQNANLTYYAPPRRYQKVTTGGLEAEANYAFTKKFSVRMVGTVQGAKADEYSVYLARTNGPADDSLVIFNGNKLDNVAPLMLTIAPAYNADKFYASLNIQYMGKRWANVANAFELPSFMAADLNIGYTVSKSVQLSASINNLFNTYGVMGWAAPGGFPASLDIQGFTKTMKEANPNAVYSTLTIMPRAFFVTASFKF
jgi:iron complex outermembrane recepter protein